MLMRPRQPLPSHIVIDTRTTPPPPRPQAFTCIHLARERRIDPKSRRGHHAGGVDPSTLPEGVAPPRLLIHVGVAGTRARTAVGVAAAVPLLLDDAVCAFTTLRSDSPHTSVCISAPPRSTRIWLSASRAPFRWRMTGSALYGELRRPALAALRVELAEPPPLRQPFRCGGGAAGAIGEKRAPSSLSSATRARLSSDTGVRADVVVAAVPATPSAAPPGALPAAPPAAASPLPAALPSPPAPTSTSSDAASGDGSGATACEGGTAALGGEAALAWCVRRLARDGRATLSTGAALPASTKPPVKPWRNAASSK